MMIIIDALGIVCDNYGKKYLKIYTFESLQDVKE